jgi:hypothetical protein
MAAMPRLLPLLAALALAAAPVAAGKPHVDFDREYDFAACETFAWGEGGTPANDLNQRRIVDAVTRNLRAVGLIESAAAPDLHVVTHVNVERFVEPKATIGFGFGGFGDGGGIGVHADTPVGSKVSEIGNLAIQLHDPATGKLVWEAVISDTVEASGEKLERTINAAVDKAFKRYPVKPKK